MKTTTLPPVAEMYDAFQARDRAYDGLFVTAVRTTGIFCRPACPARKPRPENVEFYPSVQDALVAGYRPCRRCRPLEPHGRPPEWLRDLLEAVEREPTRRWTDGDLRERNVDPVRVRRWFQTQHGMTFHAYQRARRLGLALGQMQDGEKMTHAAYDSGYDSLSGFREAFERLFGAPPGRGRATNLVVLKQVLTPLGPMVAGATDEGLCLLEFADRKTLEPQVTRVRKLLDGVTAPGDHPHLERAESELREYFGGTRREFTIPLVLAGTDFQRSVWQGLLRIPYGTTCSYEQLAQDIGRPKAQRAVGTANGNNRMAVIIPCHRVVGNDGRLRGYGGGLWRKQFLLEHERKSKQN